MISQISFLVIKTAVLTPWIAMCATAAAAGFPVAAAISLAVSDDFSEFSDTLVDFYFCHFAVISGVTSLVRGWREAKIPASSI